MPRPTPLALLFLGVTACRCGGAPIVEAKSAVRIAPPSVAFGGVYLQAAPQQIVTAINVGAAPETLSLTLFADAGSGFSLPANPAGTTSLAGGSALSLPITFAPTAPGPQAAVLSVSWSAGAATVALSGTGLAWPSCAAAGPCVRAAFDPASGQCVQTPLADGSQCTSGASCLIDTVCAAGQCVGQPDPCDDGDACTLDFCVAGQGCQHQDQSARCQTGSACEIGSCDPQLGCITSAAPDGLPCTSDDSCQTAKFCLAGQCTGAPVPDGTPCALWWAPCVSDAACKAGTCDSPTADGEAPGQPLWSIGTGYWQWDVAIDDGGTTYLFYENSDAGAPWPLELQAIDACGQQRWRTTWGQQAASGAMFTPIDTLVDGDRVLAFDYAARLGTFAAGSGAKLAEAALSGNLDPQSDQYAVPTLTNQGLLSIASVGRDQGSVAGFAADGTPLWSQTLDEPLGYFYGNTLSDPAGSLDFGFDYSTEVLDWPDWPDAGGLSLWGALDPTGALSFQQWGPGGSHALDQYFDVLAVGADYLFGYAGLAGVGPPTLAAFSLAGAPIYQLPLPATRFLSAPNRRGAVIDGAGVAYLALQGGAGASQPRAGEVLAVSRAGATLWESPLPPGQWPVSGAALAEPHTLFLVTESAVAGTAAYVGENWLLALDTATGAPRWEGDLGRNLSGDQNDATLAVTGAGSVLVNWVFQGKLAAFFVGQYRPDPRAPWSRDTGDNRNRDAPTPP